MIISYGQARPILPIRFSGTPTEQINVLALKVAWIGAGLQYYTVDS